MASICPGGGAGIACHVLPYVPIVGGYFDVGQKVAPKAIDSIGQSVLGQVAQAMASAADGLLKTLTSFWMNIDTPALTAADSPVNAIEQDTGWITTCVAVVCILIAAARMAIRRRGEPAGPMMVGLVRLIVVSASGTFLIETAGKLSDTFSADLMSTAHLGANGWSGLISTTALSAAFAPGDGMLLIIALLIIVSSLIQLMLMVLRVGLLVILTGTLPLAAAASMSEWGETWWRKHLGWLTAWLLYKPAAAVLYASAFALTHGSSLAEVLSGFMLLVLSVLILPALLKVIVPLTSQLGAASGGSLAMGVTGALATGAIKAAAMTGTGAAAAAAAAAPSGAGVAASGIAPSASPPGSSERHSGLPSSGTSSPDAGGSSGSGSERTTGSGTGAAGPSGSEPGEGLGSEAGDTGSGLVASGAADGGRGTIRDMTGSAPRMGDIQDGPVTDGPTAAGEPAGDDETRENGG